MTQILNQLHHIYDNNITTKINKQSSENIAIYVSIFIICIIISLWINITLSTFVFMIAAIFIIYYYWSKNNIDSIPVSTDLQIKSDLTIPKTSRLLEYPDLINFLYNIRTYYFHNQTEFTSMILNLNSFMQLYAEIMSDHVIYCKENIEVAINFYQSALQNLQSMIYVLNVDLHITQQFHQAVKEFKHIMKKYIDQMVTKCNTRFIPGSINNSSSYYDPNYTKPFNYFDDGIKPYGNRN